jgi:protein-S-isoprenylcysteine O-methyltransferase Ste14
VIALKVLVWTIIVLVHGSVLVVIPYLLIGAEIQYFQWEIGVLRLLGWLPILVGSLLILWSAWDLTRAGKGTPAPFDPPKEFVVKSLYRFVRNPMYLGDLLVLIGESLLFESAVLVIYTLLMLCVFHLFVVLHEEPALRRKFGESYERYRRMVPRWIPKRSAYR